MLLTALHSTYRDISPNVVEWQCTIVTSGPSACTDNILIFIDIAHSKGLMFLSFSLIFKKNYNALQPTFACGYEANKKINLTSNQTQVSCCENILNIVLKCKGHFLALNLASIAINSAVNFVLHAFNNEIFDYLQNTHLFAIHQSIYFNSNTIL